MCLRRGTVVEVERGATGQRGVEYLVVDVAGDHRAAFSDVGLTGGCVAGDDVLVNVEAVDLGLGSGGRDVVLANLTRGLGAVAEKSRHVMKLNYSPLQHGVDPVDPVELSLPLGKPVAVFQLHGQLAPAVWAAARVRTGLKIGYVQTAGGALPGAYSSTVAELRERGLLCDHLTAAPAYGGEGEAMTTAGALHAGLTERGWDCAIAGPGPGIIGSASALGHGGMIALDSLHIALALGCEAVLVARASSGDPRERHQGISHHTRSVLRLALREVTVGLGPAVTRVDELDRHRVVELTPDLAGYAASGLPARTMGRELARDELFFEQALAGGMALALAVD
ncbi:MAG: DUF3866 family protein [Thermoleophilia bacterium]|nr:DUF3866 family protein [Thermoleophilia bacterium]